MRAGSSMARWRVARLAGWARKSLSPAPAPVVATGEVAQLRHGRVVEGVGGKHHRPPDQQVDQGLDHGCTLPGQRELASPGPTWLWITGPGMSLRLERATGPGPFAPGGRLTCRSSVTGFSRRARPGPSPGPPTPDLVLGFAPCAL